MVRRLLLAAVFLGLAGAAAAQPKDAPIIETYGREAPPPPGPRVRLFISPMGEPFRGPDGFGTWLVGADADHDGAVTLAEFRADAERFFRVLDTDGNGYIDGFEMQAYERERVPEIGAVAVDEGGRGGGRGFGGGGRRGGGHGGGPPPQSGGEAGKTAGLGQSVGIRQDSGSEPDPMGDPALTGGTGREKQRITSPPSAPTSAPVCKPSLCCP